MIIQPTSLAALTWAGAASGTTAESWRIGTVLSARPLGVNERGLLVLQIGATAVEAESPGGQLPGQFQVRVMTQGAQPLLEILGGAAADPAIHRALRERLPQQNGYAPLLATLGALAQRPNLRQLPPALRSALARLEASVRTPEDVTSGEGLRQAISRSGLFLESLLAQPHADLATLGEDDWKAVLLRLSTLLATYVPARPPPRGSDTPPPLLQRGLQAQPRQPPPPVTDGGDDIDSLLGRLHGDVQAALARLEVAQLDAAAAQAWMIEIPLQGDDGRDVLQLHLEIARDSEDGGTAWTLGFALDLPALGPVQGELQLRDLRLAVRLWAARSGTAQKLERQFVALKHRLAACGVLLDQLSCHAGLPPSGGRAGALLLKATA
ncbi:hypothetical protein ASG87_02030 [Frateuria sp. Soil773]|uniref:flagellar hook-length control protein FliK n=1 Tax=Frateuria sp. Soil773 TaxID=1736407 RepID=UPI0006F5FCBC|nr:flagellar hook-length control protein FliK [Frateuria sp. Soil773]KRE90935.1 hypothetical protein ASG87_02030 [Frateuria sp. Soil773]